MGLDFNYFLYTSPKQEVRDNHEDLLIEVYHKNLTETLVRAQYASKIPTIDVVKREILNYKFYGECEGQIFRCNNNSFA